MQCYRLQIYYSIFHVKEQSDVLGRSLFETLSADANESEYGFHISNILSSVYLFGISKHSVIFAPSLFQTLFFRCNNED